MYISSRNAKACEETAKRLTAAGPGECIAIPADLSKYEECERLAKELAKREEGKSTEISTYILLTGWENLVLHVLVRSYPPYNRSESEAVTS